MKTFIYRGKSPIIDSSAYIQDGVMMAGDVTIGKDVSIWYNCTLRGDLSSITIGDGSNVQELTTIHNDFNTPVIIGKNVTIGHACIIHGAIVEDGCMIGMGATLLNNVKIPKGCLVAAGSVVTKSDGFEEGMLIMGSPAKQVKPLSDKQKEYLKQNAINYQNLAKEYKETVKPPIKIMPL